jgi:MerR family copper efflux transcriptional regulator
MNQLTIGRLATQAGVNVETIRYYQRRQLLSKPQRPSSGFRSYSKEDIQRIRFIKRAQELGFSLKEIQELLNLRVDSRSACAQVESKTDMKIQDIDGKIQTLKQIRIALVKLKNSCRTSAPLAGCPVLEALEKV